MKMNNARLLMLGGCIWFSLGASAQQIIAETKQVLASPDSAYQFTFFQRQLENGERKMCYRIDYKGKTVVEESGLDVQIENDLFENALAVPNDSCRNWSRNFVYLGTERGQHDENWRPVYGERSVIRDHYNAMTISFSKSGDKRKSEGGYSRTRTYYMNIEARAYDEGVAFRYVFPETTNGMFLHITGEYTRFTMPEGTLAYHETWAQGPYHLLPLADWKMESERPLTMKLPNGLIAAIGEAKLSNFVRTKFKLDPRHPHTLLTSMYGSADIITPYAIPWRVVRVAEDAPTLANGNDIILNLNDPCKIKETQWIKPGKVFRCQLTQNEVKEGIDFAAERGLQYVELDAGWYGKEFLMSSDATTVAEGKDLNLEELCRYGKSKGIGVIVYVNQRALVQQLDQLLPLYKKWGIAGLKFGFVQVGNQYWTNWLHEAVRKCADYQMLVDIHDEYRPTGYSRTYPNLMTQEGIRGNEEMPDAQHNVTLPFTRFLTGAGDYTLCYFSSRVKNTHAHQLAMAVVYYSPLQFMYWYDKPNLYRGEKELEFWKQVPSVWDDTRFLQGEIGEYVVAARRSGDVWYLGAMNGLTARDVKVKTDFLEKGKKYMAECYEDDPKLNTRTNVKITTRRVKGGDVMTFPLLSSGGASVRFVLIR